MRGTILTALALCAVAAACGDRAEPTGARSALTPTARLDRAAEAEDHAADAVVRFDRLLGNQGPFIGAAGEIRGVPAGGLAWKLDGGDARLSADGELRARVRGLVLLDRGFNPVPAFQAVLSCETFVGGERRVVNLATDPVATTEAGDAEIRQKLSGIPSPCYAPLVFITSPSSSSAPFGAWFAVGGA